ncbi:MAG: chromate transporter [Finegoldia sp.]|nr:chromate transporter [Finegoldia sp.]
MTDFELFWTIFKINMVTFGGGYTIVPIIRDKFVKEKKIITDDEMLKIISLAQSCPGAFAINTCLLLGYRFNGKKGALMCVLGSTLPCLIVISIISLIYERVIDNKYIGMAMQAMSGAIAAVLMFTVIDMTKVNLQKNWVFSLIIMVMSFVLSFFFNINVGIIMLVSGLIGLTYKNLVGDRK